MRECFSRIRTSGIKRATLTAAARPERPPPITRRGIFTKSGVFQQGFEVGYTAIERCEVGVVLFRDLQLVTFA